MRAPSPPRPPRTGSAGDPRAGTNEPAPDPVGDPAARPTGGADEGPTPPSPTRARLPVRAWAGAALARVTPRAVVTTRLTERLGERAAARRRLTRRRVFLLAAVAGAVGLVAGLVLFSPLLALRADRVAVSVSGPSVDPAAVTAVVAPAVGTPLPRLDVAAITRRVAQVPHVRSASVTRDWPNGAVVQVVAREPVAAVPRDGRQALLDPDGVQVGDLVDQVPDGLPVVDVPAGERTAGALAASLEVLGALPAELLGQVSAAGADSADTVWLRLADGARVEWGSAADLALKTRVLEVLRQRPAAVYDVSAPGAPVTR